MQHQDIPKIKLLDSYVISAMLPSYKIQTSLAVVDEFVTLPGILMTEVGKYCPFLVQPRENVLTDPVDCATQ